MTNPAVYPVTAAFEKEVSELKLKSIGKAIASRMVTHLGEYEHGVAEPQVLLDWRLRNPIYETEAALKTMSAMFLDYLRTYWILGADEMPDIAVWMADADTALAAGPQEDVVRAVKGCKGHILTDKKWNFIAVGPNQFNGQEASDAMRLQSGGKPLSPDEWIEPFEPA